MTVLQYFWIHGLWLSVLMFCAGIAMLWWCVRTFFRVQQIAELARVPLTGRQVVSFDKPGRVLMRVEGIPMNPRPFRLSYHIIAEDGTFVASRPLMTGFTDTAFTSPLLGQWLYDIPRSGNYTLMVRGLEESRNVQVGCFLVFAWPSIYWSFLCLAGVLLSVGIAIGSLALFLVKLANGT